MDENLNLRRWSRVLCLICNRLTFTCAITMDSHTELHTNTGDCNQFLNKYSNLPSFNCGAYSYSDDDPAPFLPLPPLIIIDARGSASQEPQQQE